MEEQENNLLELPKSNMQCFWDNLQEEKGWNKAVNKVFDIRINDRDYRGKVCKDYLLSDMAIGLGFFIIPCSIEIINIFYESIYKRELKTNEIRK